MALPDDMAPALTDGVVLCHLANHIRPRSVASIHVPSPAVVSLHSFFYLQSIYLLLTATANIFEIINLLKARILEAMFLL